MLLAVSENVLQMITPGLQGVESLVLDLPAGAPAGGHLGDGLFGHGQIADEAVAVGDLAGLVDDLDLEPVDVQGILAVPSSPSPLEPADQCRRSTRIGFCARWAWRRK